MKIISSLAVALLFLAACYQPPATDSSLGAAHSEKWEDLLNAGDVEGLVSLYTEDARVMPPNSPMKVGREAVREEFGAMVAAGMSGDLVSIESRAAGDIAFNIGTYELRIGDGVVDTGKWIETWERGEDGTWRISSDIWNSDNPPAKETRPEMTHIMGMHKVGDPEVWLAAWSGDDGRRKDFAANGAPHVHVMQSPDDPTLTGLVVGLTDAAAFDAWLNSDAGRQAAEEDTVDLSTMQILLEVK